MTTTKLLFLIAMLGHLLCGCCDCLLTYLPGGRFQFGDLKDNQKLSRTFEGAPLRSSLLSMLLGCLALSLSFFGYLALCQWMRQFSSIYAGILLVSAVLFFIPGTAHHVFCGAVEWFYIRLGRTEEARTVIVEFFKKTSVTMIACYVGLVIFSVTLFVAVVTGRTALPVWACIFNILPLYIALAPFRIAGTGNWVSVVMFLGLLLLV